MSRREMISQGFRKGGATMLGTSLFSMLGSRAHAISPNLLDSAFTNYTACDLGAVSGRKIPFICFDLAGGANLAGSNVIVGGPGGQRDALSTAGYAKLGLPPDILPFGVNPGSVSGATIPWDCCFTPPAPCYRVSWKRLPPVCAVLLMAR
jgi:hypothetical protein